MAIIIYMPDDFCVFARFGDGLSNAGHSADSQLDSGVK